MNFALQQPLPPSPLCFVRTPLFLPRLSVSPNPRSENATSSMEQDEREVPDLPEGKEKEQGGGAPAPGGVAVAEGGLASGAASSEQEGVSGAGNGGCHAAAASESDNEDLEEALMEKLEGVAPVGNAGRGDAPGSGRNEDPATIHFEPRRFRPARRAVAHAMPPSSYRRLPLRSRKQYSPTRFIFAGDAASGIVNADDAGTSEAASVPLPTASIGSPSATSRSAGVSALANAGHGAKNEATVSSTATRCSEIDVAVDKPCSDDHNTESKDVEAGRASSSCRHPSRSRKQRRPDRCISDPEEEAGAAAAARAKARRGNVVLDRFLTYLIRTSPEQRPEWVRNVMADDVGVQEQRGSNVSRTETAGSPEGPPDGSARILAIVAILGASLALSLVSCVLFYIVDQRTGSGLPDTNQKK
ncbi:uncharacterized protein LOC8061364 [Sorghum bicolor]|uniref:uncharacterized protein LOC8061364 n=1 Tax=Sorghum bicolor TaxID=4558 RepID=UPI000B425F38|nr:uncharacterized protein LOC8061364 [Sorghum bicolor]|eukprot:XP_021313656.1 uncharacterized protein LOC8061364 [Sorghum bicolor]